jgi:hypothetical protein
MSLRDAPPDETAEARQTAALIAAAEAMEATLSVAEALAAEGRRIDLSGLDAEAARLCAAALAAPRSAATVLRLRIEALVRALDRLRARFVHP